MERPVLCRNCRVATRVLRKLGFRDNIAWGPQMTPNGATEVHHGYHSNARQAVERVETQEEYKRRVEEFNSTEPFGKVHKYHELTPMCTSYRSEIAWVTAGRPIRTTVYLAHPLSGNFERNKQNAADWLRFLRRLGTQAISELVGYEFEHRPVIMCPWLGGAEPDEATPGGREAVLADCKDTVMLYDELWYVGGQISPGMFDESKVAWLVRDLTHLGEKPPVPNHQPKNARRRR